ncbi:MAG: hypothetical protein ABIR76_15885 [Polaromonas sp.]
MATHTWVDLKIPEASLLADLNGIVSDLQRAREFSELLISQYCADPPNWQMAEPLSVAIAVTYSRAFSKGVRHHLNESDLGMLSVSQRETHIFMRAYRDKHIAHSVNEFEENIVRAQYCLERVKTEGITAIGYGGARITGLGSDKINELIEITKILENDVRIRITEEEKRLLSMVRALPLEEVLQGGQKAFQPVLGNVSKRRK